VHVSLPSFGDLLMQIIDGNGVVPEDAMGFVINSSSTRHRRTTSTTSGRGGR
jgi:hypothetical protein